MATPTASVINARDVVCVVDVTGIAIRSNRSIWKHSGSPLMRGVQLIAVIGAAIPALTVGVKSDSILFGFMAYVVSALAVVALGAWVDSIAIQRATDAFIPAASVQRVDLAQSVGTGTFTIHFARDGSQRQTLLTIDNTVKTQTDLNEACQIFRVNGWMTGKCDQCGYYLLPRQTKCPECGTESLHAAPPTSPTPPSVSADLSH